MRRDESRLEQEVVTIEPPEVNGLLDEVWRRFRRQVRPSLAGPVQALYHDHQNDVGSK